MRIRLNLVPLASALLLALLPRTGAASGASPAEKPMDLYLLVGQSNMAGRGEIGAVDREIHPRVFTLGPGDRWEPASEPLHFDKANRGTGPGLAMGKTLAEAKPDAVIGLIPNAVGGTIIEYWEPGHERGLYEDAVRRARIAMKDGQLQAIVWQQGESDSTAQRAPLYQERLISLMTRFRADLGDPHLLLVFGGLGDFLKSPHYQTVNQGSEAAAAELKNAVFVPASRGGHIGDRLHFNAAAQRENGANHAAAVLRLEKADD